MVELARLVAYLDALLDVERYDEGEPANCLLVDAGRPVHRLAVAVNTSFVAVEGARAAGAELLLVHHGSFASIDLALQPRKEAALRAAGVSLYGAHVALDGHPELGSSPALARRLGVTIDGRFAAYCGGEVGVHGHADGSFAAFVERVRARLAAPVEAWSNVAAFGRVGIVTGAGGRTAWIEEAAALGCDTYLTGEGSMYTKLYARERGVNLIFATHHATERYGAEALAEHLGARFRLPWTWVPEEPDIL